MKHTYSYILSFCFLAISFIGCQNNKHATTIAEADALMHTNPDSALQILKAIPHPERLTGQTQADYALLLTQARSRNRIIATSDSLIRIATNYYQHSNNHSRKSKAFLYLGDVYMDMQNYTKAMKALKQAEEVAENAEARVKSQIYSNLGYLNRKTGNYNLALVYFQKALKIDNKNQSEEWIISDLINILNLPIPELQDSTAAYVTQLEKNALSVYPDLQAKAYNNIGVYFYKCNQTERAADYFEKAIRTSASVPYRAYLNLARIYDSKGNTARADSLYQTALQSPIWATRARIYEALYNRHLHAHRYQEAITYIKNYQLATDSFYINRQTKEIQELQAKYNYEVLFREKVEVENLLLRSIIGTGFLLLLCAWGLYYFKRKNIHQLQQIENLIYQINQLENKEKEAFDLIDTLNESLNRHKVLSNEFLRVKGKWTDSEDILALGVYIRLKRDLSLYNPSSDLSLLGHWLDMVSIQFATRFEEEHHNLTASELNVCYLQRMGYSTNEIAQAMHIKTDSIKRYIYRACTKMCIPQSYGKFTQYISRF